MSAFGGERLSCGQVPEISAFLESTTVQPLKQNESVHRIVWDNAHALRRIVASALIGQVVACAAVKPSDDFQEARALIRDRTNSADVFDPEAEEMSAQKVQNLLTDGLTIDDAVCVAMINNRGLQALFQEIGVSRADVVQSSLFTNPTLSLGARFPEGGARPELTAGIAQQIADLWQIPVRKRIAEARLKQTIFSIAQHANELAAAVRRKYTELAAALRAEELARESVDLAQQSLDLVRTRFEIGESDPFDVHLIEGQLLSVQVELATLEGERKALEIGLARVLGLSRDMPDMTIVDSLPSPVERKMEVEALLLRAAAERLDVRVAALTVDAAENELVKQGRNVFPSVIVGLTGERTERRGLSDRDVLADTARASIAAGQLTAPSIQPRSERDQQRRQFIDALLGPTLSITLPLWDQNQAGIAKARFQVIQRRKQLDDLLDTVAEQVRLAALRVERADTLIRFFDDQVIPRSRENVERSQAVYQSGQQGILVWIDAQEALIAHQRRLIATQSDYALALIDLELSVGGRLATGEETTAAQPIAIAP